VTEQAVPDALADYTLAFEGVDPDEPGGLGWLGERLAGATVVGLGEATHGTREFAQFKTRLLRHLVVEADLRALCLEAGFAETLAVDRYVTDGEGTATEVLSALRGWSWAVAEVRDLLVWLREFNADRPREDRVRVYGLDAQYTDEAVAELRRFLRRADLQYLDQIRDDLDTVDDGGTLLDHRNHDRRVEAADRLVAALRERFGTHRDRYAAATSPERLRFARRCLDHIEHAVAFKRAVRARRRSSDSAEATARCLRQRDRAMAAAVEWVREQHPRVAVWAHDAHLNRSGQRTGEGGVRTPSLGSLLADRHGDAYLAVGFAFGRGDFRAITEIVEPEEPSHVRRLQRHHRESPDSGSVEETLAALAVPVGVVDLGRAREDDRLAGWLGTPQSHFEAGVVYGGDSRTPEECSYVYSEAFDLLCYVDETTATRPL
jgi:erythromycin esterase